VPAHEVADPEELARYCKLKDLRGGRVRSQIFIRTKNFPAEVSVDRALLCNPSERVAHEGAERQEPRAHVILIAGAVRGSLLHARVLPATPPPEHAEIHTIPEGTPRLETREAMALADMWDAYQADCDVLARLSKIPPEYLPQEPGK
jgi:hypothetical protein